MPQLRGGKAISRNIYRRCLFPKADAFATKRTIVPLAFSYTRDIILCITLKKKTRGLKKKKRERRDEVPWTFIRLLVKKKKKKKKKERKEKYKKKKKIGQLPSV